MRAHSDCAALFGICECHKCTSDRCQALGGGYVTIKAIKGRHVRQGMIVATWRFERIIILRADKVDHRPDCVYPGVYVWEINDDESVKNQIYIGSDDYIFDVTPRHSNEERAK